MRGLIKFIDRESQVDVVTHFEDTIDRDGIEIATVVSIYKTLQSYKNRVESYIRKNKHHTVIQKLSTNLPITKTEIGTLESILFNTDKVGSKQDYLNTYGDQPLGEFIRSIVGLDIKTANEIFAEFIQVGSLQANQMTFVNTIITHLTRNGMIDKTMLFQPPFTDSNDQGLIGVFDDAQATRIIRIVDRVNDNARVAVG